MVIDASTSLTNSRDLTPSFDFPVAYKNRYAATVVHTIEHFSTLEKEWEELLESTELSNVSLHHAWLSLWLNHFPPENLFVILVRDGEGNLRGAAPFLITRNQTGLGCRALKRLQFIGTAPDLYDWMDILIHPDADSELVIRLVGNEIIRNRAKWDLIDLRFFGSLNQLMSLELQLNPVIRSNTISQLSSISYIDLPPELSEYQRSLRKKKYHSDLKRVINNIQKDFNSMPTLVVHQPGPESDKLIQQFLKTHQSYWLSRGSKTEYSKYRKLLDFYTTLHREFSTGKASWRPVFEFTTLNIGDKIVSYHFDVQTREGATGCMCSYLPEVKKYRPGHLHIESIIERTYQLGGGRFVFGRGEEGYKNQWKIQKKPLWHLLAFRDFKSQFLWNMDKQLKMLLLSKNATQSQHSETPTQDIDNSLPNAD